MSQNGPKRSLEEVEGAHGAGSLQNQDPNLKPLSEVMRTCLFSDCTRLFQRYWITFEVVCAAISAGTAKLAAGLATLATLVLSS